MVSFEVKFTWDDILASLYAAEMKIPADWPSSVRGAAMTAFVEHDLTAPIDEWLFINMSFTVPSMHVETGNPPYRITHRTKLTWDMADIFDVTATDDTGFRMGIEFRRDVDATFFYLSFVDEMSVTNVTETIR